MLPLLFFAIMIVFPPRPLYVKMLMIFVMHVDALKTQSSPHSLPPYHQLCNQRRHSSKTQFA